MNKLDTTSLSQLTEYRTLPDEIVLNIFTMLASQVSLPEEGFGLWNTLRSVCHEWRRVADDPCLLPSFLINPLNRISDLSSGNILSMASLFSKHPFHFDQITKSKEHLQSEKESYIFRWVVGKIDPNLKNPFMVTLADLYAKSFQKTPPLNSSKVPGPSDEKDLTDYPTNILPKIPLKYFGS